MSRQADYKRRKRQEQIQNGQAKFQQMETCRLAVQACKERGLSQSRTTAQTGIHLSKVKRLWNRTAPYTGQGEVRQ